MKMIILAVLALVALSAAAPQGAAPGQAVAVASVAAPAPVAAAAPAPVVGAAPEPVKILKSEFDQQPDGGYVFAFETEDGVNRDETGELKEVVDEEKQSHSVVVVKGSYSYPGEDGKPVLVSYYADETGFHAEGDSIPKAA